MPLRWSAEDLLRALRGESFHEQSWCAEGLSIDSRTLKPGDVFLALEGQNYNGHAFAREAFEKGAVAAIVQQAPGQIPPTCPLIYVDSTAHALWRLAEAARKRTQARIIAVTGSVGKTTTKELLRLMLGGLRETTANEGSQNNLIGVPLALARMPAEASYGIFEIAQNPPDDVGLLSQALAPDVALITNIASDSTTFLSSADLFQGLSAQGIAILPRDTPHYAALYAAARARGIKRILSFGKDSKATARLLSTRADGEGLEAEALVQGHTIAFRLGAKGEHLALNATAALLAASAAGADPIECAESLSAYRHDQGRGTHTEIDLGFDETFTLIDETEAATLDSVKAALTLLRATPTGLGGRRIAVLGDFQDQSVGAPQRAASLFSALEEAEIDLVFCCGEMMESLNNVLPSSRRGGYRLKSSDLAPHVATAIREGDVIMVKGAKKMQMSLIVDALRALEKPALPEERLAC